MSCGRNCVPDDESNCFFEESARTTGFLSVATGSFRGIRSRLKEGDRFPGKQILAEAQWFLYTLISGGGFPAYQMVSWAESGGSLWMGR